MAWQERRYQFGPPKVDWFRAEGEIDTHESRLPPRDGRAVALNDSAGHSEGARSRLAPGALFHQPPEL